ncbi:hypothetical protein HDU84_003375 [Entophlyctis sp. JEL0112]|nr:hypothetical protein HDU84_003375 [Entophlyctis sp. JEL0112]
MDEFDESDKQWQRASLKQKTESKAEKKLKKALKKHEEDSYVSDDDEAANIFGEISEEEDSEQELETKQPPKPGDPAPTAQQGSTSPNVSGSKASSPSLVPAVSTPDPAKLAKQKKKELDISGYDAVSAARKAMYSSVIDTNQLRSLSGFTVAGGASSAMAKVVTGGSGAVIVEGGKSPDAPKGRSPDLNSSTPKIRLKVGGTVVTAGESQKRKADDSKLETSKRPKTEPPPPPTAAEVIGGQRKKSSNSKANSPNLSANGSSGDSKQRSKASDSRTSPNVQMPAASPRIEELRGGSKSSGTPRRNESETSQGSSARPSPSVSSGGTPTSTPSVNASTSASPSLDDANTLTDAELRSLFAPPNTVRSVRELVALNRMKILALAFLAAAIADAQLVQPLWRDPAKKLGPQNAIKNARSRFNLTIALADDSKRSVSLTDFVDEYYTTSATIGKGQTFNFDLDTGSSDVWIRGASCTSSDGSCGASGQSTFKTSDTTVKKTGSTWTTSYGSGEVSGNVYSGTVALAGVSAKINFGVTTSETGFNFNADGLWGLAYSSINEISGGNFVSTSGIANMSFYFSNSADNDFGELTINGLDTTKFSGTLNYVSISSKTYYQFNPKGATFTVGSQSIAFTNTGNGAIADTGTSLFLIPNAMSDTLNTAIGSDSYSSSDGVYPIACSKATSGPNIVFKLGAVTITIPPSIYVVSDGNGGCFSGISQIGEVSSGSGPAYIFGDTFLRAAYTVFDVKNSRIGFAQAIHP